MCVVRSEDLGSNIVNAEALQYCTHGTTGDDASSLCGRLEQNAASTVFADHFVRQGAIDKRHSNQVVLCRLDRFLDRIRHFLCLTGSKSYVSGLVADDN